MKPLDLESVRRRLPGRELFGFDTIDSTMSEAVRLARAGWPSGTTVIAEEQTAGQGRHGHSWHSEPRTGLYVSIILQPALVADAFPTLTLALGLATAEAISRTTGLRSDVRWPNDVMLGGKKAAGILVQYIDPASVAGIGINVNQTSFPEALRREATSLRLQTGTEHSREDLLILLLVSVDAFTRMLVEGGRESILDAFCRASSYARGRRVQVAQGDRVIEGVTAGLDPSGFLLVREDDGTENLILAGGVRAAGPGRR